MNQCQDVLCENRTVSGYCKFTACTKHEEKTALNNNENKWIKTEDGSEYKNIRNNGYWKIIRWRHDAAYYSFCSFCGYIHSCYKDQRDEDGTWGLPIYAPEKEFNYCPMCGMDMEVSE